MNLKIKIHERSLQNSLDSIQGWKVQTPEKRDVKRFIEDLGLGKVNLRVKSGIENQAKYLAALKVALEFLKRPATNLTIADIECLEKALTADKLRNRITKQPYSPETKSLLKKVLKCFLKWRLGESKAHKLTYWLDTRVPHRTPDYLNEQEGEKLYRACRNAEQRFLIAVLFDGGMRAEEFHNIRFEDIQLPAGSSNFVRLTLKEEYSKTAGRVIGLYWKYSTEAVREYLEERKVGGPKAADPVFKNSYDNTRWILRRLGERVLKKNVHYHLLRHSSATYYASKLNRQELCYRYGWRFSSAMPDTYISRSGMMEKELQEKFTSTHLEEVRLKLVKQEQENKMLMDIQEHMKDDNERLKREFAEFKAVVKTLREMAALAKRAAT